VIHSWIDFGERPVALRQLPDAAGNNVDQKLRNGNLLHGRLEEFAFHTLEDFESERSRGELRFIRKVSA
jgi:hypothetical protein